MSILDWIILIGLLSSTIVWALYKSNDSKTIFGYFLSNKTLPWYLVLVSIMATQASAITFISGPGQGFSDGMRFIQLYFGMPFATLLVCLFFAPTFAKLNVYTAYEYLENRFGLNTRLLASGIFLLSRGLSTGVSVCVPSLILSALLGWNLVYTNIFMGSLLLIYTVYGGSQSIVFAQLVQFTLIMGCMILMVVLLLHHLPYNLNIAQAWDVAHLFNKTKIITTGVVNHHFNWGDKYNLWSGLIGGFFLALSYYGTDQSQVARYLNAKDLRQSQKGLIYNALLKIPMQFLILFIGVLLFLFYRTSPNPIQFNNGLYTQAKQTSYKPQLEAIEKRFQQIEINKSIKLQAYLATTDAQTKAQIEQELVTIQTASNQALSQFQQTLQQALPNAASDEANFVLLHFITHYMPHGLIGLLLAIVIMSTWGSVASTINSLSECTMVDFYFRLNKKYHGVTLTQSDEERQYRLSKWISLAWGIFCVITAQLAVNMGSLLEAVNVLGSLFYGVMLGLFVVALGIPFVKNKAVFIAAMVSEGLVVGLFVLNYKHTIHLGFLWLNVIGCLLVVMLGLILQLAIHVRPTVQRTRSAFR